MTPEITNDKPAEILIAEDSPTQAARLHALLERHGYAVVSTCNGEEALAAAQRHKPALIISDVLMPKLDGYGLCRAIKSDQKLKDIPVILVTTLFDPQDVMRGLECGADNFLRKPYDDRYLISRLEHVLLNHQLRKQQNTQAGVEVDLNGRKHVVTADRQQILDLLISTYEQAVEVNSELKQREKQLSLSNRSLAAMYRIAEELNKATTQREVCDAAMQQAMSLPGVQACWISVLDNSDNFTIIGSRNLPPVLTRPQAMDGSCTCRRMLRAGELNAITDIPCCERLQQASSGIASLRAHVSVPIRVGQQTVGMMNLIGSQGGLFDEHDAKSLSALGNQLSIAFARASLHEHLEQLVQKRTATLTAEVEERRRIQKRQDRLIAILDATPDLVSTATPDGRLLSINQAGLRMLRFEQAQDVSTMRVAQLHPQWAREQVLEKAVSHAIKHGTWSGETSMLRQDGKEVPVSQVIIAHKRADGTLEYLSTIARDITQRKEYEARIVRLNRIHSVLSGINTTILRTRDQEELLREACRIAVEHGGFVFAWIGMIDVPKQQIRPVAKAGHDDGYISPIDLTPTSDVQEHSTPPITTQALAKPIVCNDIATDPHIGGRRDEALKRGYRSAARLPLTLLGQPVGVFEIYATEPGVFDEQEMKLLMEIAGEISFALDHFKKEEQINYLAYYDAITGLPNRTLFWDRVNQRINAARCDKRVFSVIVLDIERFSGINESLGRQAGDDLLRQIAGRLELVLDETDTLARLSADHFGIAIWSDETGSVAARVLERILGGIRNQPFLAGGKELRLAARAGVSSFPSDGEEIENLYLNAEAALKMAKLSGGKYLFYTDEINSKVAEKLTLENKLRSALEQQQLTLYYQPKIDVKTGRICGLEALMRWNDPDIGSVPPSKFIPILEGTGLILEAGMWALVQAMADSRLWQSKGIGVPRIAVNVSPMQLREKDFVSTTESVVNCKPNLASVLLQMEVTESLIMQDVAENIQKIQALRGMGVEVAIDDFGTGYSSLSYIAKLPVNALKIDRAFIVDMANNPHDLSIVSTIVSLAHSLNIRVVAEGVETQEQANLLRLLKCDEIQGYLFSPAVPAEQIEQLLRDNIAKFQSAAA